MDSKTLVNLLNSRVALLSLLIALAGTLAVCEFDAGDILAIVSAVGVPVNGYINAKKKEA